MGSRRGSTGSTAARSLPWPLGIATEVDTFRAVRTGMLCLPRQQSNTLAKSVNKRTSLEFEPIEATMLVTHCIATFVSLIGSHQPYEKKIDTSAELESLKANCWPKFEFRVCEVFRFHMSRVQETDLGGPLVSSSSFAQKEQRIQVVRLDAASDHWAAEARNGHPDLIFITYWA